MSFITGLVQDGYAPNPWTEETIGSVNGFKVGKYAMVLADMELIKELEETDLNYGISLVPEGKEGSYSDVSGTSMVIFRNSYYPREAYKFIRFLTSEKMQIKWAKELGRIPVNNSALTHLDYEINPHLELFMDQFQRVKARPMLVDVKGFEEVVSSEIQLIIEE